MGKVHLPELLNFYKQSGWLPRFSAPGPISFMLGTAIDMVFADAVVNGIVTNENDIAIMLDGMLNHANEPCDNTKLGGRDGVLNYNTLGYIPLEYRESVNKKQLEQTYFNHKDIEKGGKVLFRLTDTPSGKTYSKYPFSLSDKSQ